MSLPIQPFRMYPASCLILLWPRLLVNSWALAIPPPQPAPRCCDYRCTSPPRSHMSLKRISPSVMKGSFWYPLLICRDQEAEPSAAQSRQSELEWEQMNSVLPSRSISFKIVQLWEAWTSGPSWCLPKSLSLGVPMASRLRAILESGSGW